jgi:HPt (histidine-containing phosphotransfer) domain-containing protein
MSKPPIDRTATDPGPPDVDPAAFARLQRLGGLSFVHRVVTLFLDEAQPKVESVRASFVARDPRGLAYWSHSLVSSSGNVGLTRVQAVVRELEHRANGADWTPVRALVAELDEAFARARRELERRLAELPLP